jgi:hypothetical protein
MNEDIGETPIVKILINADKAIPFAKVIQEAVIMSISKNADGINCLFKIW